MNGGAITLEENIPHNQDSAQVCSNTGAAPYFSDTPHYRTLEQSTGNPSKIYTIHSHPSSTGYIRGSDGGEVAYKTVERIYAGANDNCGSLFPFSCLKQCCNYPCSEDGASIDLNSKTAIVSPDYSLYHRSPYISKHICYPAYGTQVPTLTTARVQGIDLGKNMNNYISAEFDRPPIQQSEILPSGIGHCKALNNSITSPQMKIYQYADNCSLPNFHSTCAQTDTGIANANKNMEPLIYSNTSNITSKPEISNSNLLDESNVSRTDYKAHSTFRDLTKKIYESEDDEPYTGSHEHKFPTTSHCSLKDKEVRKLINKLDEQIVFNDEIKKILNTRKTTFITNECHLCESATGLFKANEEKRTLEHELLARDSLLDKLRDKYPNEELLKGLNPGEVSAQLEKLRDENMRLHEAVDGLTLEKLHLQEVVLQRSKALSCLSRRGGEAKKRFDGTGSEENEDVLNSREVCAMQLGAEAIAMVEKTGELREKVIRLEDEIKHLRETGIQDAERLTDLEERLGEKRGEAAALTEAVVASEQREAALESRLRRAENEIEALREKHKKHNLEQQEALARAVAETEVQTAHNAKLREQLAARESHSLSLQEEILRQTTAVRDIRTKYTRTSSQLDDALRDLQRLMRSSVAKDTYMSELEKKLKENEIRRQASYMAEMARSRKAYVETLVKQEDCQHTLAAKEEQIRTLRQQIAHNKEHVQKLRDALFSNDLFAPNKDTIGCNYHEDVAFKSHSNSNAQPLLSVPPNANTTTCFTRTLAPANPCPKTIGAPQPTSNSLSNAPTYLVPPKPATGSYIISQKKNTTIPLASRVNILQDEYIPVTGDPIDEALANFLRVHQRLRKQFFRLSRGDYIFADRRIKLRLDLQAILQAQLEPDISEWLPMDVFIGKIDVNQAFNK